MRRLAALAVAVTEDARRLATRLRLSNSEAKALDSMGHRWWRLEGMDEARARRRLYRLGEGPYRDRLLLAWARAAKRCGSRAVDRARAIAAALHAAEISTEGGRLHLARHSRRACARPCADACRGCLARCRFSARAGRARFPRRSGRGPAHPRLQTVNIASGFANVSPLQLLLVAIVALFASLVGGLAGYGTGALMPLVLVPMVGAEPVVPIIAISAIFANLKPQHRLFPLCRRPPRADRDRLRGGDHRARRLWLHQTHQCRCCARHRQHADPERAAAARAPPPGGADQQWRACCRRDRLWRRGRRHVGLGRDPAVAVDGRGPRRRGGYRHRCGDLGHHQRDQDFGVRAGRRRHRAGARLCAV